MYTRDLYIIVKHRIKGERERERGGGGGEADYNISGHSSAEIWRHKRHEIIEIFLPKTRQWKLITSTRWYFSPIFSSVISYLRNNVMRFENCLLFVSRSRSRRKLHLVPHYSRTGPLVPVSFHLPQQPLTQFSNCHFSCARENMAMPCLRKKMSVEMISMRNSLF